MTHMELANSNLMAVLCGATILIVLIQPILFLIAAVRRGKELQIPSQEMKEAARGSAIFSIIPSLPIVVSYLILVPSLGRYFPWLRLSVVGSAVYEAMVANMAANAFGYESMLVENIPPETFIGILFVVSTAILGGNVFNVFFLKSYDKKVEALKNKHGDLVPIITTTMLLAMYGTFSTPYVTDITNIPGIAALISAGIFALLLNKVGEQHKKFKEYAFPLSMIGGMLVACLVNVMIL